MQSQYYSILQSMLKDKIRWSFSQEKGLTIAKTFNSDGSFVCLIEWDNRDTFTLKLYATEDLASAPPRLYIKSNSAYLLGLADDFRSLYDSQGRNSAFLRELDSLFRIFIPVTR